MKILSVIAALLTCLLGCSGTNYLSYTGGVECDSTLDQINKPTDTNTYIPVSLDPNANDPNLPVGDFKYRGMTTFFYDQKSTMYVSINETINPVAEAALKAGKDKATTTPPPPLFNKGRVCVRNYNRSKVATLSKSKTLVVHLDNTNGQKFFTKKVGFHINEIGLIDLDIDDQETALPSSTTPVDFLKNTQGFATVDLYKVKPPAGQLFVDYQLVLRTQTDKLHDTVQAIVYMRLDLPPPPKPQKK